MISANWLEWNSVMRLQMKYLMFAAFDPGRPWRSYTCLYHISPFFMTTIDILFIFTISVTQWYSSQYGWHPRSTQGGSLLTGLLLSQKIQDFQSSELRLCQCQYQGRISHKLKILGNNLGGTQKLCLPDMNFPSFGGKKNMYHNRFVG